MPKPHPDGQAVVVNCSDIAADPQYVDQADVQNTVDRIDQQNKNRDQRDFNDWQARQAHADSQRQRDLAAHGEAMARRQELIGKLNEVADRNPDIELVLQALGMRG